jgi:hypothetical protein
MKRTLIMFFFVFCSLVSFAPSTLPYFYIPKGAKITIPNNNYNVLIEAIGEYESGNRDTIINQKEQAYGRLQIRQCRVDHYNRLTGKNYTLKDMFDFSKAREVFLYFAEGKIYEHAAKDWNGSGPLTITYWECVKNLLHI